MALGWFACFAGEWEAIAESLPKPWADAAIRADLCWYADRMRRGHKRPGRPALRRRWGVTDWHAKRMLQTFEPPEIRQAAARKPPEVRQKTASTEKVEPGLSGETHQESASPPPENHQKSARKPPRARSRQRTETETETEPEHTLSSGDDGTRAPLLLSVPEAEPSDDWAEAARAYAALPGSGSIRKRTGKLGRALSRMLDDHGLAGTLTALGWLTWAHQDPKIRFLRERGNDTIATVAAHPEYAKRWRAWSEAGQFAGRCLHWNGAAWVAPSEAAYETDSGTGAILHPEDVMQGIPDAECRRVTQAEHEQIWKRVQLANGW